jgi:naked cuticle
MQDITSLLHTIYEVVDSSVNHSPTSSKTLRVKLTVAPDGSQSKKSVFLNHTGEGYGVGTRFRKNLSQPGREERAWAGTGSCFVHKWALAGVALG